MFTTIIHRFLIICVCLCTLTLTACDSEKGSEIDKKGMKDIISGMVQQQNNQASITIHIAPLQQFVRNGNQPNRRVLDELEALCKGNLNIKLEFQAAKATSATSDFTKHMGPYLLEKFDAMIVYNDIAPLIEKDYIMDLTELFKEHAPQYYSQLSAEDIAEVTYDGKIMAIPNQKPGSGRICAVVRAELLEECNMDIIKNFDDYEKYLKAAKTSKPNLRSTMLLSPSEAFIQTYGYALYGAGLVSKWDDPDIKLMPWEQTSEFWEALTTQHRWVERGYYNKITEMKDQWPLYETYSYEFLLKLMEQEQIASFIANWDIAQTATRIGKGKYKYKIFPLDMVKPASEPSRKEPVLLIGKNSKNAERILKFIELVNTDQQIYDLLMCGIEGEHYTLENGMVKLSPDNVVHHYNWLGSDFFRNSQFDRAFVTDSECNPTGYEPQSDDNLRPLPTKGFNARYEKMVNAIDDRYNLLELTLSNAYFSNWNLHTALEKTIEEADRRVGESAETVTKVIQRQLDEWRAEKD